LSTQRGVAADDIGEFLVVHWHPRRSQRSNRGGKNLLSNPTGPVFRW
jgi:hypothetical protein